MSGILQGRRVLVTQAGEFMGPVLCEVIAEHGAEVVASKIPLSEAGVAASLVASSGEWDGLVANHVFPAPTTPAVEVTDAEWQQTFAALVDPLPKLVRAVKVNAITQNFVNNPTTFRKRFSEIRLSSYTNMLPIFSPHDSI